MTSAEQVRLVGEINSCLRALGWVEFLDADEATAIQDGANSEPDEPEAETDE